jgi:heme exporter protein A
MVHVSGTRAAGETVRRWENQAVTKAATVQPARQSGVEADGAVVLRGASREFGDLVALDDVSVGLPGGETLAVLGPNGAGKTTLLRILASLLRPSAGAVGVLGCELPREAWRVRGRIGYLGHRALLYRDLTVGENLRFHARLHRLEDPDARIASLLSQVQMERRAAELVRNLSAGMVQRIAVCRAVLHQPGLLLLDEPRSHLDPAAAELVEPLIGADTARTRVLVTHDVEGALAEADRVLLLRAGGRVAYEGPARGLSAGDARAAYGGAP